jgi:RHS repeat-associated protein
MEEVVYGDAFDFHDGADEDVEYEYDANGNMTVDLNRGIKEIEYDVNNRPVSVTFSTRPAEQRTKYLYDASGRKLRTTYQTSRFLSLGPDDLWHVDTLELNPGIWDHIDMGGLRPLSLPGIGGAVERRDGDEVQPAENLLWSTDYTRDYCGDIIYKDGEIERILTDNGYAVPDSAGGYDYYYYVKDWQGNVRAVIDEANRRMELNNYYPYGMPMSSTASVQPYKYGGKELDRTNGLDMYDYGARWYDMIVPHFITIDPMAEKNCSVSPYSYCGGNPINRVDPTGMDEWEINKRGEIVNRIKTKEHDAFYIVNKNGIYEREYSVDNEGNKKYNSISFKYGTIESQRSISYNKSDSYDIYQVRGDDTGEKLFTFLSDNVSVKPGQVEFTLTQSGIKGSSGLNFITTGHMRGSEPGFKYLFEGQLVNGYILRNIIHSHPVGKNAGRNDVIQIGNIRDNLQPRGLPMPLFFIYHVPTKSYKQYND